jgi:hypothetical protein
MTKPSNIKDFCLFVSLAVSLSSLLAACADPPPMILVRGAAPLDEACVAAAAPTTFLVSGRLDLSVNTSGYLLFPNVENVSPPSASTGTTSRSSSAGAGASGTWGKMSGETNLIFLRSATVSFNFLTDGVPSSITDLFGSFQIPISSQALDPDGGRASVQVPALNSQHVAALSQIIGVGQSVLIEVSVVLNGVSSGDRDVESNTFTFPLEVCNTCLIDATCAAADAGVTCNPGQDKTICTASPTP